MRVRSRPRPLMKPLSVAGDLVAATMATDKNPCFFSCVRAERDGVPFCRGCVCEGGGPRVPARPDHVCRRQREGKDIPAPGTSEVPGRMGLDGAGLSCWKYLLSMKMVGECLPGRSLACCLVPKCNVCSACRWCSTATGSAHACSRRPSESSPSRLRRSRPASPRPRTRVCAAHMVHAVRNDSVPCSK
jgi:hypothetical protein